MDKRQDWIDIAKGLLIILMVFGHSAFIQYFSDAHTIIYWFHMPAFFVLSGMLHKSPNVLNQFPKWVKIRVKKYMITYFLFIGLITIYRYLFTPINYSVMWVEFKNILLGGRFIDGYYAPIWFITCLLATQILFALVLLIEWTSAKWIMIILSFIVAHVESMYAANIKIIGNIDVALFALLFYAIGYFVKEWLLHERVAQISIVLFIGFIYLAKAGKIQYFLDLKQHGYHHIFLDIIIPLTGIVGIIAISKMFEHSPFKKILIVIGRNSLMIMYLHLAVALELYRHHMYTSVYMFVVTGVLIPTFINEFIKYIRNIRKINPHFSTILKHTKT